MTTLFPLSAIVGQQELIEALLINAVAPEVSLAEAQHGEVTASSRPAGRSPATLLWPSARRPWWSCPSAPPSIA